MFTGKLEKSIKNFKYIWKTNPVDDDNHRLLSITKKYFSDNDTHIREIEQVLLNKEPN